ncbi:hypothetical protein HPB51_008694 [Rhipicephalus microplus]|uniref:Structural maintenance of chromosomes protein 5 n=1 Tax=Rhipicephalus microplus TaxID=6941 RepID=A0A9J6EZ88_RHIMP|nr:hypothetical protein HPB51_008694 [Rhipicephalus microplus]
MAPAAPYVHEFFNVAGPTRSWSASTTGQNTIIERRITGSKSTWKVNGVTLPQKSVEHLVAKLNIQVSNLCQFLPQDRVADFVRMSRQELLEGTERAVGSSELFDLHQRLKELQQMRGTLEASLQGLKTRLEQERQKVSHLDAEACHNSTLGKRENAQMLVTMPHSNSDTERRDMGYFESVC